MIWFFLSKCAEAGGRSRRSMLSGLGYSAVMTEGEATKDEPRRVGLCFDCLHAQRIQSARGSTFYRCKLSDTDPRFPKYPRLPVIRCAGYAQKPSIHAYSGD